MTKVAITDVLDQATIVTRSAPCPLYPQQRTLGGSVWLSVYEYTP